MSGAADFAGMSLEDAVDLLAKARMFDFGDNVTVQRRGSGNWAIVNILNEVYSRNDEWIHEMNNSARTPEFKCLTQYTFAEAFSLLPAAKMANDR